LGANFSAQSYSLYVEVPNYKISSDSFLKKWLSHRRQVIALAGESMSKANSVHSWILGISLPLRTMAEILVAWAKGDYRRLPWRSLVAIAGAIIYFVNPLDLVPDFLGAAGYIDDIFVVRQAWKMIQGDVLRFNEWKKVRGTQTNKSLTPTEPLAACQGQS
jgi:uncharacterized membrane protein YkvA (DUF1232 family)